jgi:uncharacterized protein (DUF305 family)
MVAARRTASSTLTGRDGDPLAADATGGAAGRARATWPLVALVAVVALAFVGAALVVSGVVPVRVVPAEGSAEAGFARDMSTHHAQAVQMAELIRTRTEDAELRTIAADIALTQQAQIGWMSGWLDVWGLPAHSSADPMAWMHDDGAGAMAMDDGGRADTVPMPGMAAGAELARLRDAEGVAAERLFLRLMIDHHRGGVDMAEAVLERSDNVQVRRLADAIVVSQEAEITAMRELLDAR